MSIKLVSAAFQVALPPAPKLVLLALCDEANDNGDRCWPSVATIARKSSISERQAQRVLRWLEERTWIAVVNSGTGGGRGRSNRYSINLAKLVNHDILAPIRQPEIVQEAGKGDAGVRGAKLSPIPGETPERVTPVTEKGDTHVTRPVTTQDQKPRAYAQGRTAAPTDTVRPAEGNSPERGREPSPKATAEFARQLHALGKITAKELQQALVDVDEHPGVVAEQLARAVRGQQAAA